MRPYIFRLPEWLGSFPDWVPLFGGGQIGGRPLFSYGAMLGLAILTGFMLSLKLIDRLGCDRKRVTGLFIWAIVGALLGARILYFIASAPGKFSFSTFLRFDQGGLVAYGGFIGGFIASFVFAWRTKTDWLAAADGVAPSILLGTGITRTGCFLFGCDYGVPTDLSWGLKFPRWDIPAIANWIPGHSPAYAEHLNQGLVASTQPFSLAVQPTQLFLSASAFIGFALLMLLVPYRRFKGEIILGFLVYYGATRFSWEFLRGDSIRGTGVLGSPFSTSQFISLLVVPIAVIAWALLRRKASNQPV